MELETLIDMDASQLIPKDLDSFLRTLYEHHHMNGIRGVIANELHQCLFQAYVLFAFTFPLFCFSIRGLRDSEGTVDISDFIQSPQSPFQILLFVLPWLTYLFIWIYRLVEFMKSYRLRYSVKKFYENELKCVNTESWTVVVNKICELQSENRGLFIGSDSDVILTPWRVASRILRKENYLLCVLQSSEIMSRIQIDDFTVFILWWVIVQPLFKKHQNWKICLDQETLRKRCIFISVMIGCFCPVILMVLFGYYILRISELWAAKGKEPLRSWSGEAYWTLRGYNEYPYIVKNRMILSVRGVEEYLSSFASPFLRHLLSTGKFIAGSLAGMIAICTLLKDEALTEVEMGNVNLLWWLTFFTGLFTIFRSLQPNDNVQSNYVLDRQLHILKKSLRYCPEWWEDNNHIEIKGNLQNLFPYHFLAWMKGIYSVIRLPYDLYQISKKSQYICEKIRNETLFDTVDGDVCKYSVEVTTDSNISFMKEYTSYSSFMDDHT